MTYRQLRRTLARLGLSQRRFGRLVHVDPRTARRWALGEVRVPGSVALLLAAWLAYPALIPPLAQRRTL